MISLTGWCLFILVVGVLRVLHGQEQDGFVARGKIIRASKYLVSSCSISRSEEVGARGDVIIRYSWIR